MATVGGAGAAPVGAGAGTVTEAVQSTGFDATFRAVATALVNVFGVHGTSSKFRYSANIVYTPATRVAAGVASTKAVKTTPPINVEQGLGPDSTRRLGDALCYLDAKSLGTFVPTDEMKIQIAGTLWQIVKVNSIYSGNLVAAYELELKR